MNEEHSPIDIDHDGHYRQLFHDPRMVSDLLQGFIDPALLPKPHFHTLERIPDTHIAEQPSGKFKRRHQDSLWRLLVDFDGHTEAVYIHLLLEFQARSDRLMAQRMSTYANLAVQTLIKAGYLKADDPLPLILPIVLYNGEAPWSAPLKLSELQANTPPALRRYQPQMEYIVIDQRHIAHLPKGNLVSILCRGERFQSPLDFVRLIQHLYALVDEQTPTLFQSFNGWIGALLPRHIPGAKIGKIQGKQQGQTMINHAYEQWKQEVQQEGFATGVQQGIQQGVQQGIQQGRQEGRQEGATQSLRETLVMLLSKRFGTPPSEAEQQQLMYASQAELRHWLKGILSAPSIAALLSMQPPES